MSCLGLHLALTEVEVATLKSISDSGERLDYLHEALEAKYLVEPMTYVAESDKAWDAMHRAFSDGLLSYEGGEFPLNHVVLGGERLHDSEDYLVSLKTPEQVKAISSALAALNETAFRSRYDSIDPQRYDGDIGEDDFQYTWSWLQEVRRLYLTAASEGRYVLFSADQ